MNKEGLALIAGRNLKHLLKKRHLTQEQGAYLLHVEERTLRRWIKDGIDRLSTIELICRTFNIDAVTTLFNEE
ncbi:MAG: helix-turn-helix transcriptional regulator [Bacilli bacterium]|nr:helix-turn-helix transcriptional regulator [Bacilli bacterium]